MKLAQKYKKRLKYNILKINLKRYFDLTITILVFFKSANKKNRRP